MNEPRQDDLQGLSPLGFHKIAYVEWGDKENPDVLVCVHGFSRNSRDFDYLARALQHKYRIICPDMVGRGNSDYKGNPAIYNSLQYVSDLVALLARIDVKEVNWLGTSMGGILGMTLASQANTPIKKLILNDVGMFVPKQGLQRILSYAKIYPSFKNLQLAEESLRQRLVPFGIQTPEEWQHLVKYGFKQGADGQYHYAFDSAIVDAFEAAASADGRVGFAWRKL
jgi:pimeloyl-ACP methyl ester carboxylesterase